jgi:hypothetical protein
MNEYRVYSSQRVFYVTKILAESEEDAKKFFDDGDFNYADDLDELGKVEIDNIEMIQKGEK